MKNIFKTPLKELVFKNSLVVSYRRMWPYIKPYWFRALLGVALAGCAAVYAAEFLLGLWR